MFYYKLNLFYKDYSWLGTKATKNKNFLSPQWLEILKEKISFLEIRCIFFKSIQIKVIENGGWHFTCLKTPEELEKTFKFCTSL